MAVKNENELKIKDIKMKDRQRKVKDERER